MITNFSFKKNGLSVTFRDLSTGVPDDAEYHWDFGDLKGSDLKNPEEHIYDIPGFYLVTLTISTKDIEGNTVNNKVEKSLGVTDQVKTTLSDSIYNLINTYVPDDLVPYLSDRDKQVYIEKWQLYLQPILEHDIPLEEYNNEMYYEALENQLIMELSAYDYLTVGIMNMMRSIENVVQEETSTGVKPGDTDESQKDQRVKEIVTGPTSVQFYEGISGDTTSSLAKAITGAMQPGGVIDSIKKNICMLSQRLNVYLPICDNISQPVVPKVINRRVQKFLKGPNPSELLNNPIILK